MQADDVSASLFDSSHLSQILIQQRMSFSCLLIAIGRLLDVIRQARLRVASRVLCFIAAKRIMRSFVFACVSAGLF